MKALKFNGRAKSKLMIFYYAGNLRILKAIDIVDLNQENAALPNDASASFIW